MDAMILNWLRLQPGYPPPPGDLSEPFAHMLFQACAFWVIVVSVIVVYLALSKLLAWRWGGKDDGSDA
ncbi:MAG TPA: hypothetical protein VI793_19745 [Anaerolineales bacterium]|nr:hypothetical protein [Anaerolineales bacterium]